MVVTFAISFYIQYLYHKLIRNWNSQLTNLETTYICIYKRTKWSILRYIFLIVFFSFSWTWGGGGCYFLYTNQPHHISSYYKASVCIRIEDRHAWVPQKTHDSLSQAIPRVCIKTGDVEIDCQSCLDSTDPLSPLSHTHTSLHPSSICRRCIISSLAASVT